MDFGAAMFFTDYSMKPAELGQALEARGFESVWAPEHSHIPSSRLTPPAGGGQLGKQYYDVMDPFVTLTAAAMATKTLKVATGVCLFKKMREQIEAMTEIWTKAEPEYDGEIVNVPKMRTWPKPAQKPRPPVIVGAPSRTAHGARCATATGGCQMRADRHIPM